MEITIKGLLNLFLEEQEQQIAIYDLAVHMFLYEGITDYLPEVLEDIKISTIDNLEEDCILTINVDTLED